MYAGWFLLLSYSGTVILRVLYHLLYCSIKQTINTDAFFRDSHCASDRCLRKTGHRHQLLPIKKDISEV